MIRSTIEGSNIERDPLTRSSRLSGRRLLDTLKTNYHTDYSRCHGRWVWCGCHRAIRLGDRLKWPSSRNLRKDDKWADDFRYRWLRRK